MGSKQRAQAESEGDPAALDPLGRTALPRGWSRWVPGWRLLRAYRLAWLPRDVVAGIALTAVLIPAGMGYAQAAGLDAIAGLYATLAALLAYAVFGPSKILVLGPDSALAALIAAAVLPLSGGDPARALGLAGLLALLSGAACVLAGVARLGFVADLLSRPTRHGYLNGIALTVIVSQLPRLLGIPGGGGGLVGQLLDLGVALTERQVNGVAAAIGLACLVLILAVRRWAPAVPGVLLAVVGATAASWALDLEARSGLAVVGALPQGLPVPRLPLASLQDLTALVPAALAVALVSFADMSVLSRTFALRTGQTVDGNQELVALGLSNLAAGLFQGFPISASASRTPVAEAAGARSQLTGVVGALTIGGLLVGAPRLVAPLPTAALGAVVIAACLSLVEVRGVLQLYRLRSSEFYLSVACFLGVALLGVIQGIFIAVALALLALVWRAWRPYSAVLGRVDGVKGYHDVSRHPEARRIPGLVLLRWDAPLFFANAEIFHRRVHQAVAEAPTPTRWVVVAAEPVTDVDVTAADMLAALDEELHGAGMDLCFAELKGPVKDHLKRYGLFTSLQPGNFFPTLGKAVDGYLSAHPVEWRDWDE